MKSVAQISRLSIVLRLFGNFATMVGM